MKRGKHSFIVTLHHVFSVPSSSTPPSSYVNLVHMDYLQKICNENGSSLQGLKYIGGPVHICEEGDNQPEVVPCVSFPDDEEAAHSWKCTGCLKLFDIEELLNPKVCI